MVRPEITFVVPMLNVKMFTELFPLIVNRFVPGPCMVVLPLIVGRADARVMVPVIEKVMVSSPVVELAFRMACRSEPGPESSALVTTKSAALASRSRQPRAAAKNAWNFIGDGVDRTLTTLPLVGCSEQPKTESS